MLCTLVTAFMSCSQVLTKSNSGLETKMLSISVFKLSLFSLLNCLTRETISTTKSPLAIMFSSV